jgi:hypothetical protein
MEENAFKGFSTQTNILRCFYSHQPHEFADNSTGDFAISIPALKLKNSVGKLKHSMT